MCHWYEILESILVFAKIFILPLVLFLLFKLVVVVVLPKRFVKLIIDGDLNEELVGELIDKLRLLLKLEIVGLVVKVLWTKDLFVKSLLLLLLLLLLVALLFSNREEEDVIILLMGIDFTLLLLLLLLNEVSDATSFEFPLYERDLIIDKEGLDIELVTNEFILVELVAV